MPSGYGEVWKTFITNGLESGALSNTNNNNNNNNKCIICPRSATSRVPFSGDRSPSVICVSGTGPGSGAQTGSSTIIHLAAVAAGARQIIGSRQVARRQSDTSYNSKCQPVLAASRQRGNKCNKRRGCDSTSASVCLHACRCLYICASLCT